MLPTERCKISHKSWLACCFAADGGAAAVHSNRLCPSQEPLTVSLCQQAAVFVQTQVNGAVMAADIVAGFRHLDELCEKLNECLYATTAKPRTSAELRQSNRTEGKSSGAARGGRQGPGSAGPVKPGPDPAEGSLREPNSSESAFRRCAQV